MRYSNENISTEDYESQYEKLSILDLINYSVGMNVKIIVIILTIIAVVFLPSFFTMMFLVSIKIDFACTIFFVTFFLYFITITLVLTSLLYLRQLNKYDAKIFSSCILREINSNIITAGIDFYANYSSFKNKIREYTGDVNAYLLFLGPDVKIGVKAGIRYESTDETPFTTIDYYKKEELLFKIGSMFILRPFEDLQIIGYVGVNLTDDIPNIEASISAGMRLGYKEKKILLQEPSKPNRLLNSTPMGYSSGGDAFK